MCVIYIVCVCTYTPTHIKTINKSKLKIISYTDTFFSLLPVS